METIDYAMPAAAEPPSDRLRRDSIRLSALASVAGVVLLAIYATTGSAIAAIAACCWLLVGGLITLAAFVRGAIYAVIALRRGFPAPATPARAWAAILLPVLAVCVAILCVAAGISLIEHYGPPIASVD